MGPLGKDLGIPASAGVAQAVEVDAITQGEHLGREDFMAEDRTPEDSGAFGKPGRENETRRWKSGPRSGRQNRGKRPGAREVVTSGTGALRCTEARTVSAGLRPLGWQGQDSGQSSRGVGAESGWCEGAVSGEGWGDGGGRRERRPAGGRGRSGVNGSVFLYRVEREVVRKPVESQDPECM